MLMWPQVEGRIEAEQRGNGMNSGVLTCARGISLRLGDDDGGRGGWRWAKVGRGRWPTTGGGHETLREGRWDGRRCRCGQQTA